MKLIVKFPKGLSFTREEAGWFAKQLITSLPNGFEVEVFNTDTSTISQRLADLANIVIINGKVVKNRHGNIKDGLDGLLKIKKIDNIIIQFEKNVFICCKDKEKICDYKKIIKKLKDVFGEEIINSRIKFI